MIRKALRYIQNLIRKKRSLADFKKLYLGYLESPRRFTTQEAQRLLRQAFLASKGGSLDWAWQLQKERSAASVQPFRSDLFPKMDGDAVRKIADTLQSEGYCVLPWKLPISWVDAVTNKAKTLDVSGTIGESDIQKPATLRPTQAVYWHKGSDLALVPELKALVNDPGLRAVATAYLECEPVVDVLAAWWTYPVSATADSKAAQLYHFDLDRIRWLKVFVYLTDVDATTGPHAYIRGSHKTIGKKILHDGRYSDAEVFAMYSKQDEVVFTGPAGTIIIEDTLGFHKGVPATAKHRFIFEYELSINHFGYPYENPGVDT